MNAETSGEIKKLRVQNEELREEVERRTKRGAYFWAVMVITSVVAGGGSFGLSAWNVRQSERKLCALVVSQDDNFHRTPPSTPLGKEQARNFANLRRAYGCPPYQEEER